MPELTLQELEATAAAYEERLVPALFRHWTEPVVLAAEIRSGQRVLDVACGTGALARRVAAAVGPNGSVVGLDLNPGMLAVAGRTAPGIDWQEGSAEALPFDDETFDAVVSQFGLMLFADPVAALKEMRRVLSPGGRLALAVFDGPNRNPAYAAIASVYEQRVGKAVADALRFPFSLGDMEKLLSLFTAAGIESAQTSSGERTAQFPSMRDMVLADVKGWFPLAGFELDDETIEAVVGDAENALAPFFATDGTVSFQTAAHIVTAAKC